MNQLMKGLMGPGLSSMMGGNNEEKDTVPAHKTDNIPNKNANLLNTIRKHNNNKKTETNGNNITTEKVNDTISVGDISIDNKKSQISNDLILERERRKAAEEKAEMEKQWRKQNELLTFQINELTNKLNQTNNNKNNSSEKTKNIIQQTEKIPYNNYQNEPINQILSDAKTKPRYKENPLLSNNNQYPISLNDKNEMSDIFDSEIKNIDNKMDNISKSAKKNLDELVETLEESEDIDLDDVIETSKKKNTPKKHPVTTKTIKNNSVTRSSKKKKSDSISDALSTTKRNIIKL